MLRVSDQVFTDNSEAELTVVVMEIITARTTIRGALPYPQTQQVGIAGFKDLVYGSWHNIAHVHCHLEIAAEPERAVVLWIGRRESAPVQSLRSSKGAAVVG